MPLQNGIMCANEKILLKKNYTLLLRDELSKKAS